MGPSHALQCFDTYKNVIKVSGSRFHIFLVGGMRSTVIHTGPPTHPALHVRDARDAHIILEAVRLNMLPLIKHRLTASERERLASGNIFVWEEAENDGGLLRWTDGRRWSQSRMRGDYLFYEEKMETTQEEKDAKAALRARRTMDSAAVAPSTNRRKDRPNRPNGLTKQTYSALVYLPGSSHPRRWHVVAYFSENNYLRLPVIEDYPYLRNLRPPEGIFVSSKANGVRNDRYPVTEPTEGHNAPSDTSTYSQHPMTLSDPSKRTPSVSSSPSSPSVPMYQYPHLPGAQATTLQSHTRETPLPSIIALTAPYAPPRPLPTSHTSDQVRLNHPSPSNYRPLSTEDRRVLNSFRVVL